MEFRIADTFTDSLGRLTGDEQKAVKTTAFDLQMNPANPGMQFHRIDRAKDASFWSVRVSRDIRLIVHKTSSSLLLCYVGHHDAAYKWAERRKLERHPKTGAAQLVEMRETVREIEIPKYVEAEVPAAPPLLSDVSSEQLLSFGVPEEWIDDVRSVTEDTLFDVAEHLPKEAAEAILDLATGATPDVAAPIAADTDPFEHPDAQRRFRVVANVEELERALEYPWEKWAVFLHPAQRDVVERDYNGPARVAGSAGTGKTIVALHRAVHLARNNPDARVLLATFSDTLANALSVRIRQLIGNEPKIAERLEVHSMDALGRRLYAANFGQPKIATAEQIAKLVAEHAAGIESNRFSIAFLCAEWSNVVDAWQVETWEAYRDVKRLGRKTRLAEAQREKLWGLFETVRQELHKEGLLTQPEMFARVSTQLARAKSPPFDFSVIDEAQDIGVAELRFLAAMAGERQNGLFFAGDLGQRIFQQPFSWKALGVDVRGRSKTLRVNYRTSHQIRSQADRLLEPELSDVDGNTEERRATISVFNGPPPTVHVFDRSDDEAHAVSSWIADRLKDEHQPHELAIFVRSSAELPRAQAAAELANVPFLALDERMETAYGRLTIATMHLAKGLEFRAVVVMACDDEVLPSQARIEQVTDDSDLQEVYDTERHLLYVACTRARDSLLVSGVDPASEFLEDLEPSEPRSAA